MAAVSAGPPPPRVPLRPPSPPWGHGIHYTLQLLCIYIGSDDSLARRFPCFPVVVSSRYHTHILMYEVQFRVNPHCGATACLSVMTALLMALASKTTAALESFWVNPRAPWCLRHAMAYPSIYLSIGLTRDIYVYIYIYIYNMYI